MFLTSSRARPVKVSGGGVYAGDMHAQQGDGEITGHTTDARAPL